MPILCAVLFGMLNKKVSPLAPKIGVPVHIVLYAIGYFTVFNKMHYLYWVFVCFVVQCIIYFAVAKFAPAKEEFEMPNVPQIEMTPWKTGKIWGYRWCSGSSCYVHHLLPAGTRLREAYIR